MYALAGTYAAVRDLQAVNDSEQQKNIDTTRDANVMCRPFVRPHFAAQNRIATFL
jgi:hypothetical protein